jgi:hypothetical protein
MSINERKHPSIVETKLDFLTPVQSEALDSLRNKLGNNSEEYTDFTFYRFLKFNNWDVDSSVSHWNNYLNWRKSNNIDNILNSPPKNIDTINILVPYSYHKYDKENRPIYWEKTGKLKCEALADPDIMKLEDFNASHIW